MTVAEWQRLHRDADGVPLLIGPDCPDCERETVIAYCCTVCGTTWDIPGVMRWSWQGKAHSHDILPRWEDKIFRHFARCGGTVIPLSMRPSRPSPSGPEQPPEPGPTPPPAS